MPAVTYCDAEATMSSYGDDVLQYIEDSMGEIPTPDMGECSWSGLACYFLSMAIELWASSVEEEIDRALDELEEEEEEEEEEEAEPNV